MLITAFCAHPLLIHLQYTMLPEESASDMLQQMSHLRGNGPEQFTIRHRSARSRGLLSNIFSDISEPRDEAFAAGQDVYLI